jgi:putative transcriptional regulator
VAYIFEHTAEGAMGVIVNQPLDMRLGEVMSQMDISIENESAVNEQVYLGGPVQPEKGFVIHTPYAKWENTIDVSHHMAVTMSRDIIMDIAAGNSPAQYLVALGYAGWGAGQLEDEIANNVWLNGPASADIIFNTPVNHRWESAAAMLGIDTAKISTDIGHA